MNGESALPTPRQSLLLEAALAGEPGPARAAWERWFAAGGLEGLDEGSFRLLSLVHFNLTRHGIEHPARGRLLGIRRKFWAENQKLFHGVRPLVERLRERGIPVMLGKGAALAAAAYPDAGLRPMRDVDVHVPRESFPQAWEIAMAGGWTLAPGAYAPRPFCEEFLSFRHALPLRRANCEVDLHWNFLYWACAPGADAEVWRRALPARFLDLDVFHPHPTHLFLQTCTHGLAWNPIAPLRWIADAAWLLRAGVDWTGVIAEARRLRVVALLAKAVEALADQSFAAIPEETSAQLSSIPVPAWQHEELKTALVRGEPVPGIAAMLKELNFRWLRSGAPPLAWPRYWLRYAQFYWRKETLPEVPAEVFRFLRRRLARNT